MYLAKASPPVIRVARHLIACGALLRPQQWVKNLFVGAPLLFTPSVLSAANARSVGIATVAFCCAASAVYILNDVFDRHADRLHPRKRRRPIASGAVAVPTAWVLALLLIGAAIPCANVVSATLGWVLVVYVSINLLYSAHFKQVAILDMLIIAMGFVMRVAAGAFAIGIAPSSWMLECVGLVALFLAIAKRRDDLVLSLGQAHRASLGGYSTRYLDMCMCMVLGCLLAVYIAYSANAETIERLGTDKLYYTLPFVVAGIMRYLQITIVEHRSGAPTDLVLRDRFLQACMAGWFAVFVLIVYGQ